MVWLGGEFGSVLKDACSTCSLESSRFSNACSEELGISIQVSATTTIFLTCPLQESNPDSVYSAISSWVLSGKIVMGAPINACESEASVSACFAISVNQDHLLSIMNLFESYDRCATYLRTLSHPAC